MWILGAIAVLANVSIAADYTIKNYNVDMELRTDGSMLVNETIDVNFSQQKHGIVRKIATKNPNNGRVTSISSPMVEWDNFQVSREKDTVKLKIWDPNSTVYGDHKYRISYVVDNAIVSFGSGAWQELYWNVIGTEWTTSIDKVYFSLKLPKDYVSNDDKYYAVRGYNGERKKENLIFDLVWSEEFRWNLEQYMRAGEGLTVYVPFASGYFEVPQDYGKYFEEVNWAWFLKLVASCFIFWNEWISPYMGLWGFFLVFVVICWWRVRTWSSKIGSKKKNSLTKNDQPNTSDFETFYAEDEDDEEEKNTSMQDVEVFLADKAKNKNQEENKKYKKIWIDAYGKIQEFQKQDISQEESLSLRAVKKGRLPIERFWFIGFFIGMFGLFLGPLIVLMRKFWLPEAFFWRYMLWFGLLTFGSFPSVFFLQKILSYKGKKPITPYYLPPKLDTVVLFSFAARNYLTRDVVTSLLYYWAIKGWIKIKYHKRKQKEFIGYTRFQEIILDPGENFDAEQWSNPIFASFFDARKKIGMTDGRRSERLYNKLTSLKDTLDVLYNQNAGNRKWRSFEIFLRFFYYETLSQKGKDLYDELRGFKYYLEKVERPQIEAFLKEDPEYLDKILPWVVLFGLQTKLSEKIGDLMNARMQDFVDGNKDTSSMLILSKLVSNVRSNEKNPMSKRDRDSDRGSGGGSSGSFGSGSSGWGGWWGGGDSW